MWCCLQKFTPLVKLYLQNHLLNLASAIHLKHLFYSETKPRNSKQNFKNSGRAMKLSPIPYRCDNVSSGTVLRYCLSTAGVISHTRVRCNSKLLWSETDCRVSDLCELKKIYCFEIPVKFLNIQRERLVFHD